MPQMPSLAATAQPPVQSLPSRANHWVDCTLASLSLEEALAHLICPEDRKYSLSDWEALFRKVPLSCIFGSVLPVDALQELSKQPLLIAGDLEHGAGASIASCVDFPWSFAIGAADSIPLTQKMGIATAQEARAAGINWTFSPCVDLCLNHNNPVVNIRSMGDDPERVARLASVWVQSMQKHGLAACAKHFPGDGADDRDQHLCTSVNSLDQIAWWNSYGKIWRSVIDAGVMSIMAGHISLPAFQSGWTSIADALPATLSSELQIQLLRKQLGFKGVIVSDASPMIGIASRIRNENAIVANILAGSDVFLFADPVADFGRLKMAVKKGMLSEERVYHSVKRILEMKYRIGLHTFAPRPKVSAQRKKKFEEDALLLAKKSIVLYRKNDATPLHLKPGAKVMTVTLRYEQGTLKFSDHLATVDEELCKRGFEVTHRVNPTHVEMLRAAKQFDAVFVNFSIAPHALLGTVRVIGSSVMTLWRAFWLECPQAVFTTFGSPYHIYEFPHLPNFWMACSQSAVSQRAAVQAWLGEFSPTAKCPVRMPQGDRVVQ